MDEPFGATVGMPLYFLSKLARKNGVTVCQVGEGSDELFCGYPYRKNVIQFEGYHKLPIPRFMKQLGLAGFRLLKKDRSRRYEYLRRGTFGMPAFWGGTEGFEEGNKHKILSSRMKNRFKSHTSWETLRPLHERFKNQAWETSPLNWMSYLDLNHCIPELILMRVDRMSMAMSLECRVPFLDHKFVELAMSIPQSIKFKNRNWKFILKKSVRGVIPDELIDRQKQGLGTPFRDWMEDQFGKLVRVRLRKFCEETDLLDYRELNGYIEKRKESQVWCLLNLAMWWETYIK